MHKVISDHVLEFMINDCQLKMINFWVFLECELCFKYVVYKAIKLQIIVMNAKLCCYLEKWVHIFSFSTLFYSLF